MLTSNWVNHVRVATTANISLSGEQIVDSVKLKNDKERVLVKDQHNATENGIYSVNTAGNWQRSADSISAELAVLVSEGTLNAHTAWTLRTKDPISIGHAELDFVQRFAVPDVKAFGAKGDGQRDDTKAINDAIAACGCALFPPGNYKVTKIDSGMQARVDLIGIGAVSILSENALGGPKTNAIINFGSFCAAATVRNISIRGLGDLSVLYNPGGEDGNYNHRCGIVYEGQDALSCADVEVTNVPDTGIDLSSGTGLHTLVNCNLHANGRCGLRAFPGTRSGGLTTAAGTVEILGGSFSDQLPIAWGSLCYGIDIGGCDFTIIGARIVNNAGIGIGNDDHNPSRMLIEGCNFAFGANNGTLKYELAYSSVETGVSSKVVHVSPFPTGSELTSRSIRIPGVTWGSAAALTTPVAGFDSVAGTITTGDEANASVTATTITWYCLTPGMLLSDNGECEKLVVDGNTFDGSGASDRMIAAVLVKGHYYTFTNLVTSKVENNQRTVSITHNIFEAFGNSQLRGAVLYLRGWDVLEYRIESNEFIDTNPSGTILVDPSVDPGTTQTTFDKREIPRIVRLRHNTYRNAGLSTITQFGLLEFDDERFINDDGQTLLNNQPLIPVNLDPMFYIGTTVGRCGRVIRRNCKGSGLVRSIFFPDTYFAPKNWFWLAGDQEDFEYPGAVDAAYFGINVRVENDELLLVYGTPTAQLKPGVAVKIPIPALIGPITWGGMTEVLVVAVNPTASVGQVVAKTALPADKTYDLTGGVGLLAADPWYFLSRACTVAGGYSNLGRVSTNSGSNIVKFDLANLSNGPFVGKYEVDPTGAKHPTGASQAIAIDGVTWGSSGASSTTIDVVNEDGSLTLTDEANQSTTNATVTFVNMTANTATPGSQRFSIDNDIAPFCPEQVISITGVMFDDGTPNGVDRTEIVAAYGQEGFPGTIVTRLPAKGKVISGLISFPSPTIVPCNRLLNA